ncbi:ATP-binding cassette domain-containing protein [Inhella proteolytica]|uniref:ATP-binding cassette domain-containing protein n=1 Tax=Inhella proteolytica TaxID=2795029 RepID=A0A931NJU0_9BURK|nr:ATP-binding cassette domain-containing protein [Inhella proteolytica]MBH9579334.1 ATP-binding cassette domain-containing protein [Inhella proteolytica]
MARDLLVPSAAHAPEHSRRTAPPLIELRAIGRHYKLGDIEVRALDGVSLAIEAGEFVAVIGQSGSGKSTLMNVLGCLDNPTEGQFLIDGQDASHFGPDELAALRRERFGFIFQRYHLLPHLDARANAALPAVYAGASQAERSSRAQALLERLGLGERLHHKPNELSGGQQQRVSIARSLMNGGQIILADEPTGALDSASGAEMLKLLRELNERGHTIILVTHDHQVAAHARRVIELKDGKVIRDNGTPATHQPPQTEDSQPLPPASWWRRLQAQWREAFASGVQSLKGNRLRTALSMLGISIGIAAVVSILALTTAARGSIEKDVSGFMSGRIMVWRGNPNLPPGQQAKAFTASDMASIRALAGVKAVTTEREAQMTARHGARDSMVTVLGAEADTLAMRKLKLDAGRVFQPHDFNSAAQVALIDEKARNNLFKPGENPVGRTLLINPMAGMGGDPMASVAQGGPMAPPAVGVALPVTIIGVVKPDTGGLVNFGSWLGQVFVPHTAFARKLDLRTDADQFNVLLDFTVPPAEVLRHIEYRMRALHGAQDFGTWSAEEEFQKFQQVTGAMALLFAGVGAISLLVGGVGVMNIMLVSVSERTREIGIRMAVGARQRDVRLQFLVEAVLLCCLGGLVGVLLSWLGAQGINAAQSDLKVEVSWAALGVAFAVSSLVGLIFGTLPARRAAALSPVDALARE